MRASADQQLSAFLANKPGVVANLCAGLLEHGVNIRAMTVLDTIDIGTMRMVVDDVELAKQALDEAGAAFVDVPVITVPMPNRKGAFAEIARTLANAQINIEYFYATAHADSDYSLGVFRVDDQDRALEVEFSG